MSAYIDQIKRPPKTLLEIEQRKLLTVTSQRRGAFRDYMILSIALDTGLREHEIAALNVGDIYKDSDGNPRRRVQLRVYKGSKKLPKKKNEKIPPKQQILLTKPLREELKKYFWWKVKKGESVEKESPLFMSRNHNRISTRTMRHLFGLWQKRAGFDRHFSFHSLRHTMLHDLQKEKGDLRITQEAARHVSSRSTEIYTVPGDAELMAAMEDLGRRRRRLD